MRLVQAMPIAKLIIITELFRGFLKKLLTV
jgi:hypothetical protein